MIKIYLPLTREQRERGVVFSSTLSLHKTEQPKDVTHELTDKTYDFVKKKARLMNDSFFNDSPYYKYNIVRQ